MILHLTRDLGVNLAGVEIILNMREKMGEMQAQIEEFVATLNRELAARHPAAGLRRAQQPDSGDQRPSPHAPQVNARRRPAYTGLS